MEILIFCLVTIILSYGLEFANELRIFKDVADAGYKIDLSRLSEIGKQFDLNTTNFMKMAMLLPVVNLMQVVQRVIQYNNVRYLMLDQLRVIDALDRMSDIEEKEYLKNPTGLNAIMMSLKLKTRMSNAQTLSINEDDMKGEITYEIGESFDDITIFKVTGSLSKLSVEEQKKKIVESWKNIAESAVKKYGSKDAFLEAMTNNKNIVLGDRSDEDVKPTCSSASQELSISEQKQVLEDFKSELLEEEESSQPTTVETGKKLSIMKK